MAARQRWQPDVLGPDFEQCSLDLGSDSEGPLTATLVRMRERPARALRRTHRPWPASRRPLVNLLYLHGWSDYFFQEHVARFAEANGGRFHALDLRKYGRSLREGQTPGFVTDLSEYDAEIGLALDTIAAENPGRRMPVVLAGHSTGGLIAALWADRHPGAIDGLVLNSPWLEFQASAAARKAMQPLIALGTRSDPTAELPSFDPGFYHRTVAADELGRWRFDKSWRPERAFPARTAWLKTVLAGHETVARGLSIGVPILVMLSARSTLLPIWNDEMRHSDVALDVRVIAQRSLGLGRVVTVARYDGALHDIMLSEESIVEQALNDVKTWMRGVLPGE